MSEPLAREMNKLMASGVTASWVDVYRALDALAAAEARAEARQGECDAKARIIADLEGERDRLLVRLTTAMDAIDQALDDMGAEGKCVCEAAKAQLRMALGHYTDPDFAPAFTLERAVHVLLSCDMITKEAARAALTPPGTGE